MRRTKLLPILMIGAGIVLLGSVIVPILGSTVMFQLLREPDLFDPTAVSGLPMPRVVNVLGVASTDFSVADTWFNHPDLPTPVTSKVKFFSLSIARVGMIDVPIEVNGADLRKNAIHFPGSALPGTLGNAVIFGHSALPQFYTKDNPLTIFNPLTKTKVGDEVVVKFDGVTYRYTIKETREVTADEISVLSQRYDKTEITLITCVPLGTYWRRFVAHGELVT